jgi:hypothetical protein
LLIKIDTPSNERLQLVQGRKDLHDQILNYPAQLAGLLERCEAWLRADEISKSNWGGKRANSKRKK